MLEVDYKVGLGTNSFVCCDATVEHLAFEITRYKESLRGKSSVEYLVIRDRATVDPDTVLEIRERPACCILPYTLSDRQYARDFASRNSTVE